MTALLALGVAVTPSTTAGAGATAKMPASDGFANVFEGVSLPGLGAILSGMSKGDTKRGGTASADASPSDEEPGSAGETASTADPVPLSMPAPAMTATGTLDIAALAQVAATQVAATQKVTTQVVTTQVTITPVAVTQVTATQPPTPVTPARALPDKATPSVTAGDAKAIAAEPSPARAAPAGGRGSIAETTAGGGSVADSVGTVIAPGAGIATAAAPADPQQGLSAASEVGPTLTPAVAAEGLAVDARPRSQAGVTPPTDAAALSRADAAATATAPVGGGAPADRPARLEAIPNGGAGATSAKARGSAAANISAAVPSPFDPASPAAQSAPTAAPVPAQTQTPTAAPALTSPPDVPSAAVLPVTVGPARSTPANGARSSPSVSEGVSSKRPGATRSAVDPIGDAPTIAAPSTRPAGLDGLSATSASVDAATPTLSPAQQVVAVLQDVARDVQAPADQTAAPTTAPTSRTTTIATDVASVSGSVKSLTVQLHPDHLGPVNVTVRMNAGTVDIQIAVKDAQALHLLERDRHVLTAAVEALGGSTSALHLGSGSDSAGADRTTWNPPSFSQNGAPRQDTSADAASAGRQGQNRSPSRQGGSQSDADDQTSTKTAAPLRQRDGSLYL